ncbi:MAG: helicase-associated domain-containing protein [Candidatus Thorarchaeota archaeon]
MRKESLEREIEHMFREDLAKAYQCWGIDVSGSSTGDSLTKLLAEKMNDPDSRDRVFKTFTDGERDLLGTLVLSGGALSYDRLKPYRKIYSYGQLNQTERDLRKKGIIIRKMMSRLTDYGREVAEFKVLDFFQVHLKEYFSRKPVPTPEKPKRIRSLVDERDTLLIDALIVVSYLAKNEVRLTGSWEFPKREIDHIKNAMSKPTEHRFDLVQKMARKAGAYTIVDENRAVPGKVEALFSGDQDEVSRRVLFSALGRSRAIWATPDQPTEYTLNLVICRLREATQEEWISITEMREWIRSELFIEGQSLKWIQVDDSRVRMALETPVLLGLLEAAYKGKKLEAVRLTQNGEAVITRKQMPKVEDRDTFIVLPNFEITVFSSEMNYYKLYNLMLFATPVKTDVVSTFRITDRSIFQAIEVGLRENQILEFLEKESSKRVPKNVIRSIKDWTSQTTFATVSDVMLFETENERELENLLLIRDFGTNVVRRVGPTAVIIAGDMEKFGEKLRKHKCNVKITGKQSIESEVSKGTAITEQVLLYGDQTAADVPEDCVGCPAIATCNRVARRKARARR